MAQRKASGSQSRGRRLLEALGHREGETIGEGVGGAAAHLMQPLVVRSLHGGRLHVMAEAADAPAHAAPAGSASSVLLLRNLVSQGPPPADLAGDIVSYSASFGAVHAVRVHYVADWAARGITAADAVRVFVQFDSTVSAFRAAEAMGSMMFDGRPVAVSFFPIARFESNDFFRPDDIAGVA
jgi:splicing factor 45